MMSTFDYEKAVNAVPYPGNGRGTSVADRVAYRNQIQALTDKWAVWLGQEYDYTGNAEIQRTIFQQAWDDSHANGYREIEYRYEELCEFVQKIKGALS